MTPQRTAVFPATFDPVTNGHLAIIARAVRFFDRLVIGVYDHGLRTSKQPLLDSAAERVALVTEVTADWPQVQVRASPDWPSTSRARKTRGPSCAACVWPTTSSSSARWR